MCYENISSCLCPLETIPELKFLMVCSQHPIRLSSQPSPRPRHRYKSSRVDRRRDQARLCQILIKRLSESLDASASLCCRPALPVPARTSEWSGQPRPHGHINTNRHQPRTGSVPMAGLLHNRWCRRPPVVLEFLPAANRPNSRNRFDGPKPNQ